MKSAIVIGGGIAGCSTAYALAQRGLNVTLVERHAALAQEASGNPLAVLYPKLTTADSLQNALTLAGFEFSLNLLKKLPIDAALFSACGLIQLAFNAREKARQTQLLQQQNVLKMQHLTAAEASKYAGLALGELDGIWLPQVAWVNPARWCDALTTHVEKIYSTQALQLKQNATCWQVNLGERTRQTDIVVLCNANDITQFKQCASAKITSVRGQINAFAANKVSENLRAIICTDHFVSPAVAGLHQLGTSYAPNNFSADLSETDTRENVLALRKISAQLFDAVNLKSITGRVAWRSQTLDYFPLAGQLLDESTLRIAPPRYNANPSDLPWLRGLYVNAGHGSKGMITAPICGELIACLAHENAPFLPARLISALNPSRFLLRELSLKQLSQTLYR